ncbi:MAG: PHP domain-containing protein [Deltaproteobacteria bacterium]|jgi:predicted metal-dependent phosphoesterase TrpH|nr:PHP domain-containing protein [Deltaproteobacteria bacterium]MBW2382248.1 PHP domain-containing protein [Deltaproteobacteria bacterium]MBW2698309.1 PHP domain-containing protein [Deltaproteobacteria bacterium]
MILDLHSHSIVSDDSRAKVENYCQWIRKKAIPVDGFVLTEHRLYDDVSDYSALGRESGLLILKASEVETDYGHVLVFGVTDALRRTFDFGEIGLPLEKVVHESARHGAIAVPCHPGRTKVGMCAHIETRGEPEGVQVIETLNGGSRGNENDEALALAERKGYHRIGGSDSHIVSHIGRCATRFEDEIHDMDELVAALGAGRCEAIRLEDGAWISLP